SESGPSDAEDLYGRTKFLGEVGGAGCLTIRSSIIGREIAGRTGLLEWFLAQRGHRIKGFAGALYSGLTTLAMADLVFDLLTRFRDIEGVWHVSGEPISKFELLQRLLGGGAGDPAKIIVLSRDEAKQHAIRVEYQRRSSPTDEVIYDNSSKKLQFRIGDVRDFHSVASALREADVVFNAAALK